MGGPDLSAEATARRLKQRKEQERAGIGCGVLVMLALIGAVIWGIASTSGDASAPSAPSAPECPTTAEATYLDALDGDIEVIANGSSALGSLLATASDNPLLLVTDRFKIAVAAQGAAVIVASEAIRDRLRPTPRLRTIHTIGQRLASRMLAVVDAVFYGIDNLDAASFDQAGRLMQQVSADLTAGIRAAEQFCE